jgi:hypothetical protein
MGKADAIIVELHEHVQPGCFRSFLKWLDGFEHEWQIEGNVDLSRGMIMKPSLTALLSIGRWMIWFGGHVISLPAEDRLAGKILTGTGDTHDSWVQRIHQNHIQPGGGQHG